MVDRLHSVIRAHGEAPMGQLRTAGVRGFVDEDGALHDEPMWLVTTTHRAWLLSTRGDAFRAVATATRDEVEVRRGWVVDEVRVGPWTAPLRPSTRSVAERLLTEWKAASPHGEPLLPTAAPTDGERAPSARGALDVPEDLPRSVDAPSSERWLLAVATRSEQPFDLPDGKVERAPLWLAFGTSQQVLFARSREGATWSHRVDEVHDDSTRKRPAVLCDRRRVVLTVEAAPLVDLADADPGARWAAVARRALASADTRDAMRLVAEALDRGHEEAWPVAARMLYAAGDPLRAMAAAVKVLRGQPDFAIRTEAKAWHPAVDAQRMRRNDADVHFLRGLLREHLSTLEAAETPDDLPWPPSRPDEVWGAALAHLQRPEAALPLWTDRGPTLHRLEAEAALLAQAGDPGAAAAWEQAALAHRAASSDKAPELLDRALSLEPQPARHHLRAAWAWAKGDDQTALGHWTAAMLLDPDATVVPDLPADAERALARHAEEEGEPDHAALAWARAAQREPDDGAAWEHAARLEAEQGHFAEAARLQAAWCTHADSLEDAPTPRWPRWIAAARYHVRAGEPDAARSALSQAVAHDFLRADALAQAIEVGDEVGAPVRWWQHVLGVLDGAPSGTAIPPNPHLDRAQLDALHPGGAGWLDTVRQRLDTREAPPRGELVRGLGRLDEARYPDAVRAVADISEALGIDAPDVYLFRGDGAWGCSAWGTNPPLVLLGVQHLQPGPRTLTPTGLRFLVAVELVHLAAGHPVLAFDSDLIGTSRSIYASFGRYASTAESVVDVLTLVPGIDQIAKIQAIVGLSRKVFTTRSTIDKVGGLAGPVLERLGLSGDSARAGVGREGLEGAALQFRIQADRAALLLTGDLQAAIDAVLKASSSDAELASAAEEGLLTLLERTPAEALRLTSLVQFALTLSPEGAAS